MGIDRKGLAGGFGAHLMWGVFPLYFHLLQRSGAVEIVAHRIAWTLVFCLVALSLTRAWGRVREVVSNGKLFGTLLVAGVLVSLNWLIYVYAVVSGHIVDAALGYFINPLVTVVLALVFLRERVTPVQTIALILGLAAVLVIVIGVGRVPWIGLGLALTFGFYSLIKSRMGHQVSGFVGLGFEALALTPLSVGYIVFLEVSSRGTFTSIGWPYALLLAATGIVTALPLLAFAVGAARLPLVTLAFIQYVTPIMQFLIGVFLFGEQMPPVRWIGFILVWLALILLSADTLRRPLPPTTIET